MATKSVAQYLEFANLQIAAEAFYGKINDAPDWKIGGNILFSIHKVKTTGFSR